MNAQLPRTFSSVGLDGETAHSDALFWALGLLSWGVIDTIVTWLGVAYLGAGESNPFLAWVFADFGVVTSLLLLKIAIAACVVAGYLVLHRLYGNAAAFAPIMMTTIGGVAMVLNGAGLAYLGWVL